MVLLTETGSFYKFFVLFADVGGSPFITVTQIIPNYFLSDALAKIFFRLKSTKQKSCCTSPPRAQWKRERADIKHYFFFKSVCRMKKDDCFRIFT
jgi:hypothetical protein